MIFIMIILNKFIIVRWNFWLVKSSFFFKNIGDGDYNIKYNILRISRKYGVRKVTFCGLALILNIIVF